MLVQHDGFTATKRLDVAELELAISTATGYALTLKAKLVQPDLAEQLNKAAEHEFSKVRSARKANAGAGFSHFHPPHPKREATALAVLPQIVLPTVLGLEDRAVGS